MNFSLRKRRRRVNIGPKTVDSTLLINGVSSPYHPTNTNSSTVVWARPPLSPWIYWSHHFQVLLRDRTRQRLENHHKYEFSRTVMQTTAVKSTQFTQNLGEVFSIGPCMLEIWIPKGSSIHRYCWESFASSMRGRTQSTQTLSTVDCRVFHPSI